MSHGLSPVIASIILILVVLALAASYLIFTTRVVTTETETGQRESQEIAKGLSTSFKIVTVNDDTLVLENTGAQPLGGTLSVLIDEFLVNSTLDKDIAPGSRGNVKLNNYFLAGTGEKTLRVATRAYSDSIPVEIKVRKDSTLVLELSFEAIDANNKTPDTSAYANDGTLKPNRADGPQQVDGVVGKALKFDGIDDYVDVDNPPILNTNFTSVTIEGWVFVDSTTGSDAGLFGKGTQRYGTTFHTNSRVYFYIRDGGNSVSAPMTTGQWHHVVGYFDGTTIKLYIDGKQVANKTSSYGFTDVGATFTVGSATSFFKGNIDEVRVYNRAYEPAQLYTMRCTAC